MMSDIFLELVGGVLRNIWPLVAIPTLVAVLANQAATALPTTQRAAVPAAVLTAVPAIFLLALLYSPLSDINRGIVVETWRGWMLWYFPIAYVLLCIGRASYLFWKQSILASRLRRESKVASGRLARIASRYDLDVRQLESGDVDCFVCGSIWPTVYVTSGALDKLGDEQLAAALAHEQGHISGGDPFLFATLRFCSDMVFVKPKLALARFRLAREIRADSVGASLVGPDAMADAIMSVVVIRSRPSMGIALTGQDMTVVRVAQLLDVSPSRLVRGGSVKALLATCVLVGLTLFPMYQHCGATLAREARLSADQCNYPDGFTS